MCCHDGIIISLWCKGLNESCKTEELYAAAECYRYRLHLVVDDLSYIWCQLIILILLWCISSHNIDLPSAFICKWNAVLWQSCGASIFASKLRTSVGHSALVHRHYCLRGTQEHMWDDLLYAHAGAAIDGHLSSWWWLAVGSEVLLMRWNLFAVASPSTIRNQKLSVQRPCCIISFDILPSRRPMTMMSGVLESSHQALSIRRIISLIGRLLRIVQAKKWVTFRRARLDPQPHQEFQSSRSIFD